ncbi:hypothetical protein ACH429_14605 [Streptomyces pathocidini]|uniref:Secreted protein n=1 Tax=Streptomyces pathocidini TaxID=1650571 RepID=A0ABW7URS3_9ACTN|nr:hypothetical protein [Streptomyces pathocidini]
MRRKILSLAVSLATACSLAFIPASTSSAVPVSADPGDNPAGLACNVNGEGVFDNKTNKGKVTFSYVRCLGTQPTKLATWTAHPQDATIECLENGKILNIQAELEITWMRTDLTKASGTSHLHLEINTSSLLHLVHLEHRITSGPMEGKAFNEFVPTGGLLAVVGIGCDVRRLSLLSAETILR